VNSTSKGMACKSALSLKVVHTVERMTHLNAEIRINYSIAIRTVDICSLGSENFRKYIRVVQAKPREEMLMWFG
jgi:hypothetical protein